MWQLERHSNLRLFERKKASNLPMSHHVPQNRNAQRQQTYCPRTAICQTAFGQIGIYLAEETQNYNSQQGKVCLFRPTTRKVENNSHFETGLIGLVVHLGRVYPIRTLLLRG